MIFIICALVYKPKNLVIMEESVASEVQTEYNYSNPELTIETVGYTAENAKPIKVAKCQGCHWRCECDD